MTKQLVNAVKMIYNLYKREEEDRAIEAEIEAIRQREEEQRLAEEKQKAEMRWIEEAQ